MMHFAAYHIYIRLPFFIARRCNWMLPAVGAWAHRDDIKALRADQ